MNRIYKIASSEKHELCHPVDENDFERINQLINGAPRKSQWNSPKMELIKEDEGDSLLTSDSPWLGSHAPIFRPNAIDRIGHLLTRHGELLPLDCVEKLFVFNCTSIVDALDEEKSKVIRFNNGKLMMINKFAFIIPIIKDICIFKLPNLRVNPVLVSQEFVDVWRSADLKGLEFNLIWEN